MKLKLTAVLAMVLFSISLASADTYQANPDEQFSKFKESIDSCDGECKTDDDLNVGLTDNSITIDTGSTGYCGVGGARTSGEVQSDTTALKFESRASRGAWGPSIQGLRINGESVFNYEVETPDRKTWGWENHTVNLSGYSGQDVNMSFVVGDRSQKWCDMIDHTKTLEVRNIRLVSEESDTETYDGEGPLTVPLDKRVVAAINDAEHTLELENVRSADSEYRATLVVSGELMEIGAGESLTIEGQKFIVGSVQPSSPDNEGKVVLIRRENETEDEDEDEREDVDLKDAEIMLDTGESRNISVGEDYVTHELLNVDSSNEATLRVGGDKMKVGEDETFTVSSREVKVEQILRTSSEGDGVIVLKLRLPERDDVEIKLNKKVYSYGDQLVLSVLEDEDSVPSSLVRATVDGNSMSTIESNPVETTINKQISPGEHRVKVNVRTKEGRMVRVLPFEVENETSKPPVDQPTPPGNTDGRTVKIELKQGWNMISAPTFNNKGVGTARGLYISDVADECTLESFQGERSWMYSGGEWEHPNAVHSNQGVYVKSASSCTARVNQIWPVTGDVVENPRDLEKGWNMISVSEEKSFSDLKSTCEFQSFEGEKIWHYSGDNWDSFSSGILSPKNGLYVKVADDCHLGERSAPPSPVTGNFFSEVVR